MAIVPDRIGGGKVRSTSDETYGDEHGHHHESDGHDSTGNFIHSINGGFKRGFISLIQFRMDGLDHDNGIIDHNCDSQNEGQSVNKFMLNPIR